MSIGQSMMNWLRSVDKDQNLQGIADLTSTSMSDRVRRWFRRQDLTPTLPTGVYNHHTGRYQQGTWDVLTCVPSSSVNTTSQAAHTLTVPANHVYILKSVTVENGTRAGTWNIVYTPNGGTAATLMQPTGTIPQSGWWPIFGGDYYASNFNSSNPSHMVLAAGDTVVVTNVNFVAADTIRHIFVYEDYTIG